MNEETSAATEQAAGNTGAAAAKVRLKLVRSIAGTRESHRATVRGLGLRRLGSESELEDTASVRGMINKVRYLVKVL